MRAENRFNWRLFALILVFISLIAFFLPFVSVSLEGGKVSDLNIDSSKTFERSYSGFKVMLGTDDKVVLVSPTNGKSVQVRPKVPITRDAYLIFSFLAACVFILYFTIRTKYRPYIMGSLSLGGAVLLFLSYVNSSTSMIPTAGALLGQNKLTGINTLDALAQATKAKVLVTPGIGLYIAVGAFLLAALLSFTGKETEKSLRPILNFDNYGYYFIVPFIITYLLFSFYPIIYSFYISLTDMSLMRTDGKDTAFIGLKNYLEFLGNKNGTLNNFLDAFKNTWIIWIFNFIPQMGLAILLSVWFTDMRLKLKFTGGFKTLFYLPNVITQASVAVLFNALFLFRGPINLLLVKQFDLLPEAYNFIQNPGWTRGIVSYIQTWLWYGNTLILVIAGMLGISQSFYEAAMVDGANSGQMFTHVTLPNLRPLLKYVLITSLIGGMQMFDIPFMLTDRLGAPDGSINTMTMYLYQKGFTGNNDYGRAAVIAVALFAVIMVCNMVLNLLLKDRYEVVSKRRAKA